MYILGRVYLSDIQAVVRCYSTAVLRPDRATSQTSVTVASHRHLPSSCPHVQVGWPGSIEPSRQHPGQTWDAILGDSTNMIMLAVPLAVSSSVSRPSQLLHTSCYTAGSGSMTVSGSMAVW